MARGAIDTIGRLSADWTFWYGEWPDERTAADDGADWQSNLRVLFHVSTAARFLDAYGAMKLPSALPPGACYYMFKRGVVPDWEAEPNRGAGAWRALFAARPGGGGGGGGGDLNLAWSDLLYLLASGAGFGELAGYVCGVACTKGRAAHKITVWTVRTTAANHRHIVAVGRALEAAVRGVYDTVAPITYRQHRAAAAAAAAAATAAATGNDFRYDL